MDVEQDGLDRWFERVTKDLSDEQKVDLKRRMGRTNEVLGAAPWLREVALWGNLRRLWATLAGEWELLGRLTGWLWRRSTIRGSF